MKGSTNGQATDPDRTSRTAMNTGGNTGDSIGSVQVDQFERHNHVYYATYIAGGDGFIAYGATSTNMEYDTTYSGGNETRPKNAYVNFIIKY